MRKYIYRLGLISAALALVLIAGSSALALSQSGNGNQAGSGSGSGTGNAASSSGQANAQARLGTDQLKACQNREANIDGIMLRVRTRTQNQLTLFNTIASRVESFYANSGKTVANYSQLKAAVDSAQVQVQTQLNTMQQTNSSFSCTGNDPRGIVTAFQGSMKTEIANLQNYRLAIKNMIMAIAQANGLAISSQVSTQEGQ